MLYHLAYCQGDILLTREGNIPSSLPTNLVKPWNSVTTLEQDGNTIFIYRLDHPVTDDQNWQMVPLRRTHSILSNYDYTLAGKGAELVYWDSCTKFCGCCGGENHWMTPISKKCCECGKEWWPSPAVAIIVRIQKDDRILLVRAKNFRGAYHGLVAGFVETGENLEDAVIREVLEETGIKITDVRYFGSQSWPYPMGLMVGFTARYSEGEITLQKEELTTGGWFSRDNMPEIPDKASIARELIDDWVLVK